jgi:hypothetical protein
LYFQPKDQTSILDFIDSGKKRKRKSEFSISNRRKCLDSLSDSEDVVEILGSDDEKDDVVEVLGSDNEKIEDIENNSLSNSDRKKSYTQGFSMKKTHKTKHKKKRLFWTAEENGEENDFISEKPKLTKQASRIKQTHSLNDSWGCVRCTFQNHAELPYCEVCSTPKHKKAKNLISSQEMPDPEICSTPKHKKAKNLISSQEMPDPEICSIPKHKKAKKLISSQDMPDPKVDDNHTEQRGEFGLFHCDNDSSVVESLSELSTSPYLSTTVNHGDTCSVVTDQSSYKKDQDINVCDHSKEERFSEEKCVERSPFSKSCRKQRRTFLLETYSPATKADVDQSSRLSQTSTSSSHASQTSTNGDQFSACVQTTSWDNQNEDEESSGNTYQEMTCSEDGTDSERGAEDDRQEMTGSGQETEDDHLEVTCREDMTSSGQETEDDLGIEDSQQPTSSDMQKHDVCDNTKEVVDDEEDQNDVLQGRSSSVCLHILIYHIVLVGYVIIIRSDSLPCLSGVER